MSGSLFQSTKKATVLPAEAAAQWDKPLENPERAIPIASTSAGRNDGSYTSIIGRISDGIKRVASAL
jgi:hypothetical protein